MPVDQAQRPRFYQGQYLGPDDLTATLEHARVQEARHRLGAHSWGIAVGLNLSEVPSSAGNNQVDVFLTPGYAWDGFSRPVVVLAPFRVPPDLFQGITYDPIQDAQATPGRLIKVWLRYREYNTQPSQPGFEVCDIADQNSRVRETFQLEVGERSLDQQFDPLSIAGRSVDSLAALKTFDPQGKDLYDRSVPHQVFPDDDPTAVWLIPLGYVRWLPNQNATLPGSFVQRTPDDLAASWALRQYIGVVAGSVLAADKAVRIKDRSKPPSGVASDDLLWVEGKLRAQDDVRLFGSKVSFLEPSGQDNGGIPISLQRADQPGVSSSLQAVIGGSSQGKNTFAIGPLDPANNNQFSPLVVARDDGRVGIGTTTPDRLLTIFGTAGAYANVKAKSGQVEVLLGADDAGGIVSTMTNHDLVLRAGGNSDKMTIKASGKIGIATSSPVSQLEIAGDLGLEKMQGGSGRALPANATMMWNDGSWLRLNQNLDYTKPIFGVHTPGLFAPGSLNVGGAGSWGDPGFGNAWFTGNVSIGTTTPAGRLTLNGIQQPQQGQLTLFSQNADFEYDGGNDQLFVFHATGGARTVFTGGGAVGINTASPGHTLDVNGDVNIQGNLYFSGALFFFSDARLKRDIGPLAGALESLLKLRGVRFFWKEPEKMANRRGVQMGLVAQEVEQVFPEWVREDPQGYKRIGMSGFEALAIEAFRELKGHLDKLEKQMAGLERRKRRSP